MVAIIAIGGLLVEYMTDGTIYNRAFNALCFATNLMITVGLVASLCHAVIYSNNSAWLEIFNSLYRLAMVHLFTYFAYDSAKHQLKKTDLTK